MSEKQQGNIIIYQSEDGNTKIDVHLENENIWLTQKMMAELFQTTPQNITIHLKNIFDEGELQEDSTCKNFLQVQTEGSRQVERKQKFYNLDAIIAVGYRINPTQGSKFNTWAEENLSKNNNHQVTVKQAVNDKIFVLRGVAVMLDKHLAEFYQTETRTLKQTVKRNIARFPSDFMFELNDDDINSLVSQSVIPNSNYFGGAKPFVFTEQGVSMLSAVIRTKMDENSLKILEYLK